MNPVSNKIAGFITRMTKSDAIEPIIALEATVVTGRTFQAYKRGGKDEARERVIEEVNGSIVWLCGVKLFNDLGDKIIANLLKNKNKFDVGTDKVLRTPFDNFMNKLTSKKFSETQVALIKGAKVLTSIILANYIIGFIVPKINHALTNKIHKKNETKTETKNNTDTLELSNKKEKNPAFKGGAVSAINVFTNAIENTNAGKLLSTDVGVAGGRMINARNKEERREIAIRDIGSIYFYMWAQGHVRNLLNLFETGHAKRLDPATANILTKHLSDYIEQTGEMSAEDFKKAVLGKTPSELSLPEGINYESAKLSWFTKLTNKFRKTPKEPLQVAKVSELEKVIKDEKLMKRIKDISGLQPQKLGESVITKEQLFYAANDAKINDAEFLKKVFNEFTSGVSTNEYRYISNSKLHNQKLLMEHYVERMCKNAKDGKISKTFIEDFNKRNTIISGINFAGGFVVAALFLSTIIPKIQYWVTKVKTGRDEFPGTYDEQTLEEVEAQPNTSIRQKVRG